ncbi:MAG TPA: Gfo/Idh/MocA family oxidoreductase [Candidatus Lokiarchaeia archaeon]|nr:Gfo/Idh/MocA family oxidoreductase [Candidatus Lokiarchaeia archaeon]
MVEAVSPRLKIGVVGTGWIAGTMTWFMKLNKRTKISAACDVNPDLLRRFSKRYRVPATFDDVDSLLATADVDAVYLAIPHHLHFPFLLKCLDAGKHVFCEKPLVINLEEARQVIAKAQQLELKVGVNYQYRYAPPLYSMVRTIQAGGLGKLYYGTARCPWYRGQQYYDQGPWRSKWATAGGGTTLIHASHSIDIMAWAMGTPVSVTGEIATLREDIPGLEVEDTAAGVVRFDSGALGFIFASMNSASKENQKRDTAVNFQEFAGSMGRIACRGPFPVGVHYTGVKRLKVKPPGRGFLNYGRIVDSFAGWVLNDEEFLTPAEESLKVLSIIFGLYESAQIGQRISINL